MTSHIDPRIDHYKVLGVKQEASSADIKKAYRCAYSERVTRP